MEARHPALPSERPLMIAHRAGNTPELAAGAIAAGADLIEVDLWRYRSRLEIRHVKTMGPIPLLWDRWELHPGWRPRFQLAALLERVPVEQLLFLDLKGEDPALGPDIVGTIRTLQPERRIILCGRTWPQLDRLVDDPDVCLFYSVGSDEELANIWGRIRPMRHPAISINRRYLTPELMGRFKEIGATVVSWSINTLDDAKRFHEMGVDGFTSDNLELIRHITGLREHAFDDASPSPPRLRQQTSGEGQHVRDHPGGGDGRARARPGDDARIPIVPRGPERDDVLGPL